MMPASSPVGARDATRSTTRLTGGGAPAASRPSHCTLRLSPIGPAYSARNGAPSAYRSVTSTFWNELAMSQMSKAPGPSTIVVSRGSSTVTVFVCSRTPSNRLVTSGGKTSRSG